MSHVRSKAPTNYSGVTATSTSSVRGYASTLRKSRILIFSLLYHVQHQVIPFIPFFRNLIIVVEMLQILSLAMEPAFTNFGRHGLNEGLTHFGRIRMVMPALASASAHTASIVILLLYLALVIISGIKLALMEDGTVAPPVHWLRAWGVVAVSCHTILYLPALSILFSAMHCGIVHFTGGDPAQDSLSGLRDSFQNGPPTAPPNHTFSSGGFTYSYDVVGSSTEDPFKNVECHGEGQSIAYLILASIFLCVTVLYFGVLAFAEYGFEQRRRDKRNLFSHTLSRITFVLFLLKTCATVYVQFTGDISYETRAGIYQIVIALCFAGLAIYIFKFMPFYKRYANVVYLAFFSICFMGALVSFITLRSSNPLAAFIAFMVLLVPVGALSYLLIYLRLRFLNKSRGDKVKEFHYAFEVEIMSRPAIDDNLAKDRIRSIFWRGLKQFPDNVNVQLAFMQYLIEDTDNFQMLTGAMDKLKKVKRNMQLDTKFLLHCIEKQRMSLALAMDGGVEEVSKILLNANHHAHRAKLLLKNFWESLLHEEDLLLMPNMVAKLEHEETTADRAFRKLRVRFPQNVAVMRHYAQFLDEVKSDPDTAHELFKLAEDTEQETSTNHVFGREMDRMATGSLGPQSGTIIGEDVLLEDMRSGRKDKDKEKEKDRDTPDHSEALPDALKTRSRLRKLQLDSGEFGSDDSPRKSITGFSPRAYSLAPQLHRDSHGHPKKVSKYDLFRFRQYRDQAELFKSHSVWKITSAINLTLLILLLNMVILFATTMAVLKAQTNSIAQLSDMVDTRQNVALCISSTLRALRYTAINDTGSFQQDVSTTMAAISYLSNNTLKLYGRDEDLDGPVNKGWKTDYTTYLWSYSREQAAGDGYIEQKISTLDMITDYTFWMQQAAVYIARPNGVDNLWNATSGRYILENGLTSVTRGVAKLVDLYEQKGRYTIDILQKITITLLPLSFFLVVLLLWFLVRSAIREIQHERVTILKLFLAIPKDNILSIVSVFKSEHEKADDDEDYDLFAANEDEVSNFDSTVDIAGEHNLTTTVWMAKNSRLSMLRNFFLKFLISLFAGFFLVVIAAALILAAIPEFNANIRSINVAGQRRTLVSHLHSSMMTLAYYAETTRSYPTQFNASNLYLNRDELRSLIYSDIELVQLTDSILKFGTDGASGIQGQPFLIDLAYNQPCSPLAPYTYTCTGMNSLLVYVMALAQIIVVIPDSQLSFLTPQLQSLSDISYRQLSPMLGRAVTYYRQVASAKVDQVSTSIIAIFVVIFPVLIAVNFILRPMVRKVKQEHKRTLRMLLMIPIQVIDTTPSIKEYLDSLTQRRSRPPWWKLGMLRAWKRGSKRRGSQGKAEQLLQSHEPLLQAFGRDADEALLVVSVEGTIEMVSLSTERILGYEKRQLLGHRIASLFDEKTNDYVLEKFAIMRHQETEPVREISRDLQAKNGSGDYVPVAVTISSLKVNSKMHFGLFIKDISLLRSVEREMERERAIVGAEQTKLRELLLNVFPKSIAEQLLTKGEGSYQPQLIAEEYKEATILFADIVGFTTMCSDLEPGALLLILDGIFTQWDVLVEKHKLQKIKTIGDCFMAAGGVPDRTVDHAERVIDFAMDMTAALHRYNDTCQILKSRSLTLNIRIGINTGPVVAGIIGRSRMCFDMWGDAVNVASRMESSSLVGRIQVSQTTFNRVKNNYQFEERGSIEVKGKGAMLTYLLVAPRFYRTESGKVVDNRFAQHMYHSASGKPTNANGTLITSPSTEYNSGLSPSNNGSTTPTINLTSSGSSNVGPSLAEYNRNNRRGSLGTASLSPSAFNSYNANNTSNNNNNNSTSNTLTATSYNRRASTAGTTPATMRPIFENGGGGGGEGGDGREATAFSPNTPIARAHSPPRTNTSTSNQ